MQSLPNHGKHFYIALSHQLVANLTPIIEKWEKDSKYLPPQGITGIKILMGKEFDFKEIYLSKSKEIVPFLIKFELINRAKHPQYFNNEFFFGFIKSLVEKNIQIEIIEKSFRKVQPFTPLYSGFEEESPAKP